MRKKFLAAAVAAASIIAVTGPASVDAITRGGTLDGDEHPYVGIMAHVDANGVRQWRCSGTLISPTVFVTAGHCVSNADNSPIDHVVVWMETDLENPSPESYGYRDQYDLDDDGNLMNLRDGVHGKAHPHPLYEDAAFFLYDLGVVVLDGEGFPGLTEYGALPTEGRVDEFTSGRNKSTSTVTAVGYGLQKIISSAQGVGQEFVQADKTRYQADLMVTNTKGVAGLGSIFKQLDGTGSFVVSGDAKHGGTCFGDSGGPMLADGNVIVGVNSFGLNGNCAGIGGVYRIDQPDDLNFIASLGG